jgi:hypothetical protein
MVGIGKTLVNVPKRSLKRKRETLRQISEKPASVAVMRVLAKPAGWKLI